MNEAQYALLGAGIGSVVPAIGAIVQSTQSGRQAKRARDAARDERMDVHRLALIASWREGLAQQLSAEDTQVLAAARIPLYSQPWYLSLRPHLTDGARKHAEPSPGSISISVGSPILLSLAAEIARIEEGWGLA